MVSRRLPKYLVKPHQTAPTRIGDGTGLKLQIAARSFREVNAGVH